IAFIMADRMTHFNLQSNPKAVYLFRESGKGYRGSRLYLTKVREEKNSTLIQSLRRKPHAHAGGNDAEVRYLVYFRIDNVLPLVGSGGE
ncbi:MAG: pyridoxamine 5'-phosphate oxidase family protein, partial [Deltaproteobacteria bacterium]|nr:pyridoxamine 5'-phosphate oxidase family protein [Deltaproteobacteria bacterium]